MKFKQLITIKNTVKFIPKLSRILQLFFSLAIQLCLQVTEKILLPNRCYRQYLFQSL
jgi:hypothetical protein